MTLPIKWSPQQKAFLDWAERGTGSCVLTAVAGAGKTTVLLHAAGRIVGTVALMAFNKPVAEELKTKLKELYGVSSMKTTAGTVHSFGFGAIRRANRSVKVDDKKVRNIFDRYNAQDRSRRFQPYQGVLLKLVSLAKQHAFGIAGQAIADTHAWLHLAEHFDVFGDAPGEIHLPLIAHAQELLIDSNANTSLVDYDDMVYLPLMHKMPFIKYDNVFVDEAQDTNKARRAMIGAMLKKGGRVVAIGDPHQAIYGFTGADADALDLIKKDFNCIELPLTITYRCPKTVVEFARQWVSHISAADTAPQGEVTSELQDEFNERKDLNGSAAVLCRVNKPLVALAFALIRKRIPCKIAGRDIGESIKKLMRRWKVTTFEQLERNLDRYFEQQSTRLLARKQEAQLAVIEDQIETVRVILDQCRQEKQYRIEDAVAYVDALFAEEIEGDILTLSSIHKAKGREWDRVFWLDRANTCPSKWARQEWQQGQEVNLQYVAATRAKQQLIDVVVPSEETPRQRFDRAA